MSSRRKTSLTGLLLVLGAIALFVLVFVVLQPLLGGMVATFGIFVAIAAGWLLGRVGGTLASLVVTVVISILFMVHGVEPTPEIIARAVSNSLTLLIVGFTMGWLSEAVAGRKHQSKELSKANDELQKALDELRAMQSQLVDTSRRAGMAEIATGVLHNVGNVLNSVNISGQLSSDKLRASELPGLRKAVDLLESHESDLGSFLTEDGRGKKMILYLGKLADRLETEQVALKRENELVVEGVQHIKTIVSKQQECAQSSGVIEKCTPSQMISEAAQLAMSSYSTLDIDLVREDDTQLEVLVDRHRVLQILVNLLSNAKHALKSAAIPKKEVRVSVMNGDERFRITVSDNGVGISKENLPKIFVHGFTTKKKGHGFGLHDAANAAKAMGGELSCASAGEDCGAEFTLELPLRPEPM